MTSDSTKRIQNPDHILSVDDVYNAFSEHMNKLDELWPDADPHGPRKVHIVELMDATKLRLVGMAERNATRYQSPFERAAERIVGPKKAPKVLETVAPTGKTEMQMAFEAAQARIRR